MKICPNCGKSFLPKVTWQIYCSDKCKQHVKYLRRKGQTSLFKRTCPVCGKEFETYLLRQKCCSRKCYDEFRFKETLRRCIRLYRQKKNLRRTSELANFAEKLLKPNRRENFVQRSAESIQAEKFSPICSAGKTKSMTLSRCLKKFVRLAVKNSAPKIKIKFTAQKIVMILRRVLPNKVFWARRGDYMLILKDNIIYNLDNIICIYPSYSNVPNSKPKISLQDVRGEFNYFFFETTEQAEKAFHCIFECHHDGYKTCNLDRFLTTLESD